MVSNGKDIFIAWENALGITRENTDIFVTKVNGLTGLNEWGTAEVCTALGSQYTPQLCLDGSGEGCYVTWTDYRSGNADVWAARVTPTGQVAWEKGVCVLAGGQGVVDIVPSGSGAIVLWDDWRETSPGLYGQRLDSSGTKWQPNGVLLLPHPFLVNNQYGESPHPVGVSDGKGGAIVSIYGYRQRCDSLGNLLWGNGGLTGGGGFSNISDGIGGMLGILDSPTTDSFSTATVTFRRIDSSGTRTELLTWTSPVEGPDDPQVSLTTDSHFGAIVAWSYLMPAWETDIHCQRVDSALKVRWPQDGVVICQAKGNQNNPVLASVPGGTIVVWEDARNGNTDLYAQFVDTAGIVGIREQSNEPISRSGLFVPDLAMGTVSIRFQLTNSGVISLRIYDILGRTVRILANNEEKKQGIYTMSWDGRDQKGLRVPAGIYFVCLETDKEKFQQKVVFVK